jgi:hypothetical protein
MNSRIPATLSPPDRSAPGGAKAHDCAVRVLRSIAELEEVREAWTSWQNHPDADMDLYLMLLQNCKEVARPHVIVVFCGGRPQAMAIGRLEQGSVNIKLGYKSIANFRVLTINVIRGGLLGDQTPTTAGAILDSLQESLRNREAEMVKFSYLPIEAQILQQLPGKVSFFCREHFTGKRIHRKMTLGCTAEQMYARLSHKHRQHLRRQAKIFEKDFPGELAIRCFREPGELEQMMKDVEMVAKTTYQRGLGTGFMDTEDNRRRAEFEARQGWLRMYVLYVKAKPCAYWWGTIFNNTFHSLALGFDTEYRKYSPGTYLFSKALEELCKQGVKDIHFGLVDAQYKRQFANQHGYETIINVGVARPKMMALMLMSSFSYGLRAVALAIAERCNAVQNVKMRWRAKFARRNDPSQK